MLHNDVTMTQHDITLLYTVYPKTHPISKGIVMVVIAVQGIQRAELQP